jgi:type IV pilus assembly protein PilY1
MSIISGLKQGAQIAGLSLLLALPQLSYAAKTSTTDMGDYTQYPLFQNPNVPPISLIALSIDHQLFNKAYTDYTDMDGDDDNIGADEAPELTYTPRITYSGYFDSKLCYTYTQGTATTKGFFTAAGQVNASGECNSQWNGNFMNWASMTRLDILRWVLYGGKREVDSENETILERAHIPQDGHAFVKVFNATTAGVAMNTVTPYSDTVLSFCNMTPENTASNISTNAPKMQIAIGNWETWTLQELYQCDYDRGSRAPASTARKIDVDVRVKVCTASNQEEFCRNYGTKSKPAGLLQQYGEVANGIQFGLISGSYDRPRSGGVLRSAVGPVSAEIDQSNGRFISTANGMIKTMELIKSAGWTRPYWQDCNRPGINNGSLSNDDGTSKCQMWGNPISEIYAEAVRYLAAAGSTPSTTTPNFNADDTKANFFPGMPKVGTWTDPYANKPICTECSIIVVSTGLNSFDRDEIPTIPVIGDAAAINTATDLIGDMEGISGSLALVGAVVDGGASDTTTAGAAFRECSAKTVDKLSRVSGICPEVGSLQGGYGIAGMAFKAFTSDMRTEGPTAGDPDQTTFKKQSFRTYTLSLAESLPSIDLKLPSGNIRVLPFAQSTGGNTSPYLASSVVNFKPGYMVGSKLDTDANRAICASATAPDHDNCNYFGVISGNTEKRGSFVINWEDSTWGNDYDQDGVQILSYCIGSGTDGCGADQNDENGPDICENTGASRISVANTATADPNDQTDLIVPAPAACGPNPGANDSVLLRSEVVDTAAGFAMRFGWITAGSDQPGAFAPFIKNAQVNSRAVRPLPLALITDSNNRSCLSRGDICYNNFWTRPQVFGYKVGNNTAAKLLENPLWYAAKYGNFTEEPLGPGNTVAPNNLPDRTVEWDRLNLKGQEVTGGDGIPDAYFPVRNPNLLKEQLGQIFSRISIAVGSGTSAAVVSSSGDGPGAVFQAVYAETRDDKDNQNIKVRWTGTVRGLWVTPDGKFAEDSNCAGTSGKNQLYDPASDCKIEFKYDPIRRVTEISREGATPVSLETIRPIWDAESILANIKDGSATEQAALKTNRTYNDKDNPARYIFTWLDADNDGIIDKNASTDEQKAFEFVSSGANGFTRGAMADNNWWWLNTDDEAEAERIVNWTRGLDQPDVAGQFDMRKRKQIFGTSTETRTARLGDIVNASPLVVGAPNANIDLIYEDASYTVFQQQYANRRTVVYAGSNSGMIHAFNAGFVKKATPAVVGPPAVPADPRRGFKIEGTGTAQPHALGKELWAYVPKNLLPHLRWATQDNYTHVFYADGSPISQDVRIFTPDTDHPGGWGTILVVPFRLGGGPIEILKSRAANAEKVRLAPAYVILDITNPEVPPRVLAEIVPPSKFLEDGTLSRGPLVGGSGDASTPYAFGRPAIVFNQKVGGTTTAPTLEYDYHLVIGSGPTQLAPEVHSKRKATVYTYNLKSIVTDKGIAVGNDGGNAKQLANENSFIGDMVTADFDLGGTSDAVYFGVNNGVPNGTNAPNSSMTGGLFKMPVEKPGVVGSNGIVQPSGEMDISRAPAMFRDTSAPVTGRPSLSITGRNLPNVIFGTGRMLSRGDFVSGSNNGLYLLDDISPFTARAFAGTLDSLALPTTTPTTPPSEIENYRTLNGERGLQLTLTAAVTTAPISGGQRSFTTPAVFRGIAIFSAFTPDGNVCKALGLSTLAQVNFANQTAQSFVTSGLGNGTASSGAGASPTVFVPPDPPLCNPGSPGCSATPPTATIISQTSTGALEGARSIVVGSEGTGEQSWFEPREN